MTILVTGGAGFIGSNFVLEWNAQHEERIVNLDKLTYAGNRENLASLESSERYRFVHGDIGDRDTVGALLASEDIRAVVNFAAESHVDRSIHSPEVFVTTNIVGTFKLLEAALNYFGALPSDKKERFRFVHISTDEVYGSLSSADAPFVETSQVRPNSPYAASKASSDHLVRAYCETYGLPTVITNCSNNYGPYHFPEKLIPLLIHRAMRGETLPIYGDGMQIRDWLYVADHCAAIRVALARGTPGRVYNVGGGNEKTNLEVAEHVCALLDELRPKADGTSYQSQMVFVADRPGHDRRYAVDATRISAELGWKPTETFESGIRKTVIWYLEHQHWVERVTSGGYRSWVEVHY